MDSDDHISRVRRICLALPGTTERLSHGSPTFFANKKVYASFVDSHHGDGHVAVWISALPGYQAAMIDAEPKKFFRPPYVGVKGWVGVELGLVDDEELGEHLLQAWRLIAAKKPRARGSG